MTHPRIGYLTSQYPAPSHTFIRREVAALRAAGLAIDTYSIQRPLDSLDAPLDRAAAVDTFALLGQPVAAYAAAHLAAIVCRPGMPRSQVIWRLASWRVAAMPASRSGARSPASSAAHACL